ACVTESLLDSGGQCLYFLRYLYRLVTSDNRSVCGNRALCCAYLSFGKNTLCKIRASFWRIFVLYRRFLGITLLIMFGALGHGLLSVSAGDEWRPVTPEELKMTSLPEAPGAPAVILYRQVDRDDSGMGPHEYNYVRLKIFTEEGRKYA